MSLPADHLQSHLDRLLAGDDTARADLLDATHHRLLRLARRMLKDFPSVRRWEETDDVFQNAALRLHSALSVIAPATPLDFFRLAAVQIRRELIDMSRRFNGPMGLGANHESRLASSEDTDVPLPGTDTHDPSKLEMWSEFHRYVESLPEEDRTLYDLLWYQGMTQLEAADILGVSERTVQRHWQQLRLQLHQSLKGLMPNDQ